MSSSEAPTGPIVRGSARRGATLAVVAVILSLVALGLSAWTAWRLPRDASSAPSYSSTQSADAKASVCRAVDVVRKGISLNTNLQSPGGPGDVTGSLAVAANARVSLFDGGQYLLARLDPAAPTEVADAVHALAGTLMDIGAAATAGAANDDPDQAARLKAAEDENAKLADLCR